MTLEVGPRPARAAAWLPELQPYLPGGLGAGGSWEPRACRSLGPARGLLRDTGGPSALHPSFPILCLPAHLSRPPLPPSGPQPALALPLKASCSRSTMLDESSCSTPSEGRRGK